MNILIVDDEVVSRSKVAKLLSAYGECTEAEDGATALCLVGYAHGAGKPFDLVTMDIEMPGMRGPDALKAIRAWETKLGRTYPSGKCVKVVMLTSSGDMENVYDSFKQLCDDYIVKPVTPDKIRECVAKLGFALSS
jgi:two-component system, chemotaxis family, chemotaxis protein CheY